MDWFSTTIDQVQCVREWLHTGPGAQIPTHFNLILLPISVLIIIISTVLPTDTEQNGAYSISATL